ncbi:MAG: hypothetical protein U1E27_12530, partial [Kiritimatiellia bacterium]|nr:hypothetical protein [Kiritimatiellia bacterium]
MAIPTHKSRRATAGEPLEPSPDVPVYLLFGTDDYLVGSEAKRLADVLCPPDRQALGMEEVSGVADTNDAAVAALRRCLSAIQTVGFFGGGKLVWFRDVSFLKTAKILQSDAVKTWLGQLTALIRDGLPPGHQLLITAREIDGRSALAKACQTAGRSAAFNVPERAYEAQPHAEEIARAAFARARLRVGPAELRAFVDKVGYESRPLHQEVDKLATYLGPNSIVSGTDIETLTSP